MIVAALVALVAALVGVAQSANPKPKTIRVSVKSNGKEANSAESEYPSLSANGRFVSFESPGHFTKGDDGADDDVFVHDRKTGKTTRVSLKSNGSEASGDSEQSSISANGRYVAFHSDAILVSSDTNGFEDIYVHDRKTGKTVRASLKSNGDQVFADSHRHRDLRQRPLRRLRHHRRLRRPGRQRPGRCLRPRPETAQDVSGQRAVRRAPARTSRVSNLPPSPATAASSPSSPGTSR